MSYFSSQKKTLRTNFALPQEEIEVSVLRMKRSIQKLYFNGTGTTEAFGTLYSLSPEKLETLERIKIPSLTAQEALGLTLLVAADSTPQSFLLREYLIDQCQKNSYQGKWMLVHKLLKVFYLDLMLLVIIERNLSREVFGNALKIGFKTLERIKLEFRSNLRVCKPQRKKGYNDHGSSTPAHKRRNCWVYSGPNPEKPDLSSLCKKKYGLVNFLYG